jgi:hypothetical protein
MLQTYQCYRKRCSIPCRCQWKEESTASLVIDISFEGVIISQSDASPEPGSKVVVEFEVGSRNLPFPGEVVYSHSGKRGLVGVHFTGDCDENLDKLMPLYETHLK